MAICVTKFLPLFRDKITGFLLELSPEAPETTGTCVYRRDHVCNARVAIAENLP